MPLSRLRSKPVEEEQVEQDIAEITFSEAFDTLFVELFEGDSWAAWRVVGKVIFAEPLTPEELEVFQKFTGRQVAPTSPLREIWLAVGRRGGKTKFSAAVVVYLACFKRHNLKKGDLGRIMLLAVDMDQASECFRYISELIDSVPELATMVESRSTKQGFLRIDLNNRIQILVKPADRRRVRGRLVLAAILDEISQWWNDEINANPDKEVLAALKPSMLGMKGALLIGISSPYARKGLLWDKASQSPLYKKDFLEEGQRVVYWRAPTWVMRPDTDPDFLAFLEEERLKDPVSFDSEYGAEFRRDIESFTSLEQVEAVTVTGRTFLPYDSAMAHMAFIDTAGGGGQDSVALCITRREREHAVVCRIVEWRPPFSAPTVAGEVVSVLREYGLASVTGDAFSGQTWPSVLKENGLDVYAVSDKSKSDIFHDFLPLLNGQLVELLDPKSGPVQERAIKQLLALERTTGRSGKDTIGHPRGGVDDVINSVAGACLLARKQQSEAGKVVSVPKRQAVTPRTLNRLRPRGSVEALRRREGSMTMHADGWVGARGRFV